MEIKKTNVTENFTLTAEVNGLRFERPVSVKNGVRNDYYTGRIIDTEGNKEVGAFSPGNVTIRDEYAGQAADIVTAKAAFVEASDAFLNGTE